MLAPLAVMSMHRKRYDMIAHLTYSRREPNSYGFVWQISASAADKMLSISYITAHFLFASAKYLFTQNCKVPSGVEIFDGFSQSELKQDADLARRDLAKDAKIARRRAYAFDSLRLYLKIEWGTLTKKGSPIIYWISSRLPSSTFCVALGSVSVRIPSL